MKRLILFDFTQSARTIRLVSEDCRKREIDVVGWLARPVHETAIRAALPGVDYRPVPFPQGPTPPLVPTERIWDLCDAPTLLYLIERERASSTNMADVLEIGLIYAHAVAVLDDLRPDVILYSDVPHNLFSYVFFTEAKARGVTQRFIKRGPTAHLIAVGHDIPHGIQAAFDASEGPSDPLDPISQRQIEKYRGDYKKATPSYMRKQSKNDRTSAYLKKVAGAPATYLRNARVVKSGLAVLARRRLRDQYRELAVPLDTTKGPYVVVFLHLQPERTSCPEGGIYAQQWLLVHTLARVFPDHRILVREHPSTFRPGPKLLRTTKDYERLLAIPNVELLRLEGSPFEVIDGASCVATVTGTVGFEAICRGVPTIAFGSAPYLPCEGAFDGRSADQLHAAVKKVSEGYRVPTEAPELFLRTIAASPWVFQASEEAIADYQGFSRGGDMQHALIERMFDLLEIPHRA